MSAIAARIELFTENPRAKERIDSLREQARHLVDEVLDRESYLAYPPDKVCPGCDRPFPGWRPP